MAARLFAMLAGGGALAALPAAQPAAAQALASGAVNGSPGYTYFLDNYGNVTWLTVFGPPGVPVAPVWATTGGDWLYKNMNSPIDGPWALVTDTSQLPPFLNPDDTTGAYAQFSVQLVNALVPPPPLPDLFPPSSPPPTLQVDDPDATPGNDPGSDPGSQPPSSDPPPSVGDGSDGGGDGSGDGGGGDGGDGGIDQVEE